MKKLNLWVLGSGWTEFQYDKLSDLDSEFKSRGIIIYNYDSAKIGDYANIGHSTNIGDSANIGHYAKIKSICFQGSRHFVCYWGFDLIQIGCKQYSISEWIEKYNRIGEGEDYSQAEINEYFGYITLIDTIHKTVAFIPTFEKK